jgi:hypothetical protein
MSAVGNLEAESEAGLEDEAPGLWQSFGTALRLIVGWFSVAIGVLNLLVELDRQTGAADAPYLIFHFMLLVGGALLLGLDWLAPRPGTLGYLAGAAILLLGTLTSALPATTTVCCMSAFTVRHGYPFIFAAHDDGLRWHIDSQHLLADLMFWGYAGLIVLVVISLLRGARGASGSVGESVGPVP